MRRLLSVLLLLAACANFIGCASHERSMDEIGDITFIKVVGVDKVPGRDQVRITITSKVSTSDKESTEKHEHLLSANGETIFEAVRNLNIYSIKKPYWGHVEFIIIGEEAAKDGIAKYLDFFTREQQFRLNSGVFITINNTAESIIKLSNIKEEFITDRLKMLLKNLEGISVSQDIKMKDIMGMLDRPYSSAAIPCIYLTRVIKREKEESDKEDIVLNGFAIFKAGKMMGYIQNDKARGFNWVTGEFKSGIIVVRDEAGGKVSLEVIDSKAKVIPKILPDGKLTAAIKVSVSSNIGEMQSNTDIFNEKNFVLLKNYQRDIIKSQIESTIKYAQDNKVDVLEIWNKVFHKYPTKWKYMRSEWPELFSEISFDIEVDSHVFRTYVIKQPIGSEEVR